MPPKAATRPASRPVSPARRRKASPSPAHAPPVAWADAVRASADPARVQALLGHLETCADWPALRTLEPEHARIVAALAAGSQAGSDLLRRNPALIQSLLAPDNLRHARRAEGLHKELAGSLAACLDPFDLQRGLAIVREFKQREMLRVAARDLARLGPTTEILLEISNVADVCLAAVFDLLWQSFTARHGQPYSQDPDGRWTPTSFCVLGLGKLGGQELNYSSDVDLMFLYSDEGRVASTPPKRNEAAGPGKANHAFFKRLCEAYVEELSRFADPAPLFRVDLRLRPEGDAGPLARSLPSCENYYAQWGQTWERMMLIKARGVAGSQALAGEFLELIQPFRYPRSLSERVVGEIAAMKRRTENEIVRSGELDRNVKLGRGGIREIEFIAQCLQILNAGRKPFLQGPQTLPALQKLVQYQLLPESDAAGLTTAYLFLRDVEHRLQMDNNLQTHSLPADGPDRARIARLMGFAGSDDFDAALRRHTGFVRRIYDSLFGGQETTEPSDLPATFDKPELWRDLLAQHRFTDPDKATRLFATFVEGPGYVHVSPRTRELALTLVRQFLSHCAQAPASGTAAHAAPADGRSPAQSPPTPAPFLSDPDRVLARLDTYTHAYGSRALLYETWVSNPSVFRLLLFLFDRSEFLAELAIRTPDIVDELELSGRLRMSKSTSQTLDDLRHGFKDADQKLWIRRYHEVEFMRIGLRDILGLADAEQNLAEMTALAEACLQYAVEVTLRKHHIRTPPFTIIGLGKLGGRELGYGSDLDVTFVAAHGERRLPKLQTIAAEIMDLLSAPTEHGIAFEVDARLRPDGAKGLLVNTLPAYEEYYLQRAQLWELQALTRARPVAGAPALGEAFLAMTARVTRFGDPTNPASARNHDWKRQIAAMRRRIERERTPAGKESLAIKTGAGGLIDAEFIAQTLCLEHGWHEPNTQRALERARDSGALPLPAATSLLDNYRNLRRIESILRRWSYEGEVLLPDDPAPQYRVAVRCGFATAADLFAATARWRDAIRAVYAQVFANSKPAPASGGAS